MQQQIVLGDFVFSVSNKTAYERLMRKSTGGWVAVDIVGTKPRSYNTGQGLETITLSGKLFGVQGMGALNRLRELQSSRQPQTLVDGHGRNLGRWKIMDITEAQQRVIDNGTAMIVGFDVALEEFTDENR